MNNCGPGKIIPLSPVIVDSRPRARKLVLVEARSWRLLELSATHELPGPLEQFTAVADADWHKKAVVAARKVTTNMNPQKLTPACFFINAPS